MLSKNVVDFPYYSNGPLCADSEWVAVPVRISIKGKEFSSATNRIQELLDNVASLFEQGSSNDFPTVVINFDECLDKFKPVVEFITEKDVESKVKVYTDIVITFPEKGRFWEKMEHLSNVLDTLYNFSSNYKSDKNIDIHYGTRYQHSKGSGVQSYSI